MIRLFCNTTFGRSLMLHAPLEYDMIQAATDTCSPDADLIEQIGYSSTNPYFASKIFRRLLIKYRQNGCTQLRPAITTTEMKMRALKNRRRQLYGF